MILLYIICSAVLTIISYSIRKSAFKSRYTSWIWEKVNQNKDIKIPDRSDPFFILSKFALRAFFYLGFLFAGPIFLFPLLGDILHNVNPGYTNRRRKNTSEGAPPFTSVEELKRKFPGMQPAAAIQIAQDDEG